MSIFTLNLDIAALARAVTEHLNLSALAKSLAPYMASEILKHPKYWGDKSRVHIGKNVGAADVLFNVASGEIHIGDNTFFGHNVCILTGTHNIHQRGAARHQHVNVGNDIHIGAGVWIASNATILGPCRIGDDAVICAGAVVLPGDYEGARAYAGVPAKVVKEIVFSDKA